MLDPVCLCDSLSPPTGQFFLKHCGEETEHEVRISDMKSRTIAAFTIMSALSLRVTCSLPHQNSLGHVLETNQHCCGDSGLHSCAVRWFVLTPESPISCCLPRPDLTLLASTRSSARSRSHECVALRSASIHPVPSVALYNSQLCRPLAFCRTVRSQA
jgi:hypothetical protein